MKKVFLCLVCVGLICGISAQELERAQLSIPKQEVYTGLGLLNDNQMAAMLSDVIFTVLTLGYLVEPGTYHAFTPFLGYRYCFKKRFSLGGIFAFDYNSVKLYNSAEPDQKREVKRYYMTFAVEPKFNYMYRPAFQLYGYLGLGLTIITFGNVSFDDGSNAEISRVPYINAHLTPIGMRFGKEFGGFVEFGYGYKGIVNAGVNYRF